MDNVERTEPIFDLLKSIRIQAMKDKKWGLLGAVEKAENAAMAEILGLDLMQDLSSPGAGEVLVFQEPTKVHNS